MKLIVGFLIIMVALPFNYFFENNFNALPFQIPLAFIISIYLFKIKFNNLILVLFSIIVLFLCSINSFSNLVFSPITASFILFWIVLSIGNLKISKNKLDRILLYFIILIVIFISYYNIDFYINTDFSNKRSKGFGSGTIFSIFSVIGITYVYLQYAKKITF